MEVDQVFVQIENLMLKARRNGAIAEQNRWIKAVRDLANSHDATMSMRRMLIQFVNEMTESE
jgi:hypothetical protein